jgi:hypothetical protein
MPLIYPEVRSKQEEEREELQTLLSSGILSKAPNLQHFLDFIAEKHFAGEADQVKEYSIAVNALNRPETFDPQSDTIVRVTAHTLRKRLEQYYATEGADHPIQMQLPAGKYVLRFVRKQHEHVPPPALPTPPPLLQDPAEDLVFDGSSRWRLWTILGVAAAILISWTGIFLTRQASSHRSAKPLNTVPVIFTGQNSAMLILFGARQHPYIDAAGQSWLTNSYCKGGTPFAHSDQEIRGTDDPVIFQEGREGRFQCRIPASPGNYELKLLFADTSGDKEAARQVVFTINNGPPQAIDVVDEAGANNTAMGKVYGDIHPMSDGAIHLDFISDAAFANAAQLTQTSPAAGTSLRMLAGPTILRDDEGHIWGPESFFSGGRRTFRPDDLPKTPNAKLFAWERYGHFHYSLPVVPGKEYSITMYFSEGWFGKSNGGPGGPGSRVFDVYCNGATLLKDFDILKEQQTGTVAVTSHHVKPTAHGMLELNFEPVKNYPLINAVEVEPEN